MIRKTTTLLFCLALLAGLFGLLPAAPAPAAPLMTTFTESFDTESYWVNISGDFVTAWGIQAYEDHARPEVTFLAEEAQRISRATQGGYPGWHSEPYAWRLRDSVDYVSLWQAKVMTGGVATFSVWVRRWDGSPDPNYVVEYSIDNGDSWTPVLTINNAWLESSNAWKQVSGTINTPNGTGAADDIIIRIRRVGGDLLLVDDFEMNDSPLAVTLASFSAEPQPDHILVTWQTASELDSRGFNLCRATSADGPDRQLNQHLIPSQSQGNPAVFEYTWEDDADLVPGETYYYWLQDLDIYGATTLHGPVSATVQGPTAVGLTGLQAGSRASVALAWLPAVLVLLALGLAAPARRLRSKA